jgi:hypothetical protein
MNSFLFSLFLLHVTRNECGNAYSNNNKPSLYPSMPTPTSLANTQPITATLPSNSLNQPHQNTPPPRPFSPPPRRALLSSSTGKGPRHLNLNRLDVDLNEHQRNERRLEHRVRRNERVRQKQEQQRRRLPVGPNKANTHKPNFKPSPKVPAYKAEGTLTAEPDGVYYTVVRIGTYQDGDGIPFTLIADTGSATIAIPCKGCNCGATKHYFDMFKSVTAIDQQRSYSQCYGEGSCNSGKLLKDIMCFGPHCHSIEGTSQDFGCCSKYASSFQEQVADGIIGLGHSNTLVEALQNAKDLLAHQFAMCIGEKAGRLTVGGCKFSFCTGLVRLHAAVGTITTRQTDANDFVFLLYFVVAFFVSFFSCS